MKPIKYTGTKDNVTFHYKYSDLKKFLTFGKKEGNVGWVLISFKEGLLTYRGFGTIEHPCKDLITISLMHNPVFDGEFSIDKIMNPRPFFIEGELVFDVFDFGTIDGRPNIQTIRTNDKINTR